MAKKDKAKASKRERRERIFLPHSASKPLNIKLLGGLGAAALGAGTWAEFGRSLITGMDLPPYGFAPWLLGVGVVLAGVAAWMGTSGEAPVRVGASGIALDKGELRRMPWYAVERITWDAERQAVTARGKDEEGREMTMTLRAFTHPQACAWVLKEARDRIPKLVDVPDETPGVPRAESGEGQILALDPVQVVGKRCMKSDETILYEPDARVCTKCERVYHKLHVPDVCECGTSLDGMRAAEESA